jgi:23S rRNA pseudouridine2605 synthase
LDGERIVYLFWPRALRPTVRIEFDHPMNVPATESETPSPSPSLVRLHRALAAAGVASRRQCEQLIREGRVSVDGESVTQLGTKVDPRKQSIAVDGQEIQRRRPIYFLLNKPPGVLSTSADESGRLRAIDLIDSSERVYTVGRLDKSSEGMLLMTNDGEWANLLTHPRYGVDKTYLVRVVGRPTMEQLSPLQSGVHLAEGIARVAQIRIKKVMQNCTDLEIVLKEGRNREIRRVMARLGHKVVSLKRIAIGPIRLGELPRGAYRRLTPMEVDALRRSAEHTASNERRQRRNRRGRAWPKIGKPLSKRGPFGSQKRPGRKPRWSARGAVRQNSAGKSAENRRRGTDEVGMDRRARSRSTNRRDRQKAGRKTRTAARRGAMR